ncbi:solute carrier family 25 member 45-like [Ylistrum balloti]|uniref:solute carrier family 25 member 45-like n=1 Tax=Ylistrum balloti TaxID=509963 RepID=UPI002905B6CD|nr:solute carrier family 25 member 45-like [Ylistrum balloti]
MSGHWSHDYLAGGLGGAAGLLVGHPFDTVKVQLQTRTTDQRYRGTIDAVSGINQTGWVRGFFRGLSWPLFTFGIVNSILLRVYGNTMKILEKNDPEDRKKHYMNVYFAGCTGGAAFQVVAIPFDYIKVVLQSQIQRNNGGSVEIQNRVRYFRGPVECTVHTYRTLGLSGLYKGGTVMAVRDIPTCGLYMLTYSYIGDLLRRKRWTDSRGVIAELISGGCAGSLAWFATMPFDVIKSRYQADFDGVYKRPLDCAIASYKEEGFRVFYRGTVVTCLRAFPSCAVAMLVYSYVLDVLKKT